MESTDVLAYQSLGMLLGVCEFQLDSQMYSSAISVLVGCITSLV